MQKTTCILLYVRKRSNPDVTKPYKSIGFGAMDVTKPYKSIGFGANVGLSSPPGPTWRPRAKLGRTRDIGSPESGPVSMAVVCRRTSVRDMPWHARATRVYFWVPEGSPAAFSGGHF